MADPKKILVIRRDNIGDLLCTTPLIRVLRDRYPKVRIDVLVNSYNEGVVRNNPDINHVYFYTKGKHREAGENYWCVLWRRIRLFVELRQAAYDAVYVPGDKALARLGYLLKWLSPQQVFAEPEEGFSADMHEVERCCGLLVPPLDSKPPKMHLVPDPASIEAAHHALVGQAWYQPGMRIIGIHISARKVRQRWPVDRFARLMKELHAQHGCAFVLLWSPGDENNPMHPGDDQKAAELLSQLDGVPVLPFPTASLASLFGVLTLPDLVVCADGGAMHVAAALDKPLVCLFGNSDVRRWYPWGVEHRVIQPVSLDVGDISWEQVFEAAQITLNY